MRITEPRLLAQARDSEDHDLGEVRSVNLDGVAPGSANAHVRRPAATTGRLSAPRDGLARRDADFLGGSRATVESHPLPAAEPSSTDQHGAVVVGAGEPEHFLPAP